MIIPGRELGGGGRPEGISGEHHGLLSPPFPGVPGEQCPLQKVRSQPGLGSHQSASGHTEAVSPAAGSRTSRQLWRAPDPSVASLFSARSGSYLYRIRLMLLASEAVSALWQLPPC